MALHHFAPNARKNACSVPPSPLFFAYEVHFLFWLRNDFRVILFVPYSFEVRELTALCF